MRRWADHKIEFLRDFFILPRRVALVYALIVFTSLMVLWVYIGYLAKGRLLLEERAQVTTQVNTIGNSLTLSINQRLTLVTSVRSFMEAEIIRGEMYEFEDSYEVNEIIDFISGLYVNTAGIRNIAIAPDNVMAFVYPYEENQAVLGYDPTLDVRPYVRDEVQRAIQTGDVVLSLPYNLIQGGRGMIARQAIYNNGRYWGLANVVLDIPPLLEEAGIRPVPAGLDLMIKDQSGTVFYGSGHLSDLEPVTYEIQLPEGSWLLAAVPADGWGVRYNSFLWGYHVMGLIAIITIPLVVYLFVSRRDLLAYQVEQRTKELAQSNQTLITVLEGIDADVYVADFDTHEILFANRHLRDSFKDELIGKICFEVFRRESAVCVECKNRFLLDSNTRPTGVYVWEAQNPVTKRWYKNSDRAIRWRNGKYVHLQIAADISEQKRDKEKLEGLLQEKDILLAEVHHRVKNNLQVIISLLGLQASEIEDEAFKAVYEESRNRIKSMTLVHEQLYHSKEYAHIEFGTYIDQLAITLLNAYHIEPDQVHLQIEAKDIFMDLERAIPCGLLLNELLTNSLKYAFPEGRKGQIRIELTHAQESILLSYSDDGIGLPEDLDPEQTQSLGLQLVRLLAVHDLRGSIDIGPRRKKGAEFLIKFPMSAMEHKKSV